MKFQKLGLEGYPYSGVEVRGSIKLKKKWGSEFSTGFSDGWYERLLQKQGIQSTKKILRLSGLINFNFGLPLNHDDQYETYRNFWSMNSNDVEAEFYNYVGQRNTFQPKRLVDPVIGILNRHSSISAFFKMEEKPTIYASILLADEAFTHLEKRVLSEWEKVDGWLQSEYGITIDFYGHTIYEAKNFAIPNEELMQNGIVIAGLKF